MFQGWIEVVVFAFQKFSGFKNKVRVNHFRHGKRSCNAFLKYMGLITDYVEMKVFSLLPTRFTLVIHGWSAGYTRYLEMFSSYISSNMTGFKNEFLVLYSMLE